MEEKNLFLKAEFDTENKIAVASTQVEDRHGEIVEVEGWELKNFKKNPVLLWGHDHTTPPIGLAKNLKIEGEGKKAKLIFEPVFHEITEFAKQIKQMFGEGILRSFSVGFKPIEMDGLIYKSQELLEISAVNVPANPEAMMLAYKKFGGDVVKNLGWEVKDAEAQTETEKKIVDLENKIALLEKGLTHLNPSKGRQDALVTRQTMLKVIARANDKLLEDKDLPQNKRVSISKVIKQASQRLLEDNKGELNG